MIPEQSSSIFWRLSIHGVATYSNTRKFLSDLPAHAHAQERKSSARNDISSENKQKETMNDKYSPQSEMRWDKLEQQCSPTRAYSRNTLEPILPFLNQHATRCFPFLSRWQRGMARLATLLLPSLLVNRLHAYPSHRSLFVPLVSLSSFSFSSLVVERERVCISCQSATLRWKRGRDETSLSPPPHSPPSSPSPPFPLPFLSLHCRVETHKTTVKVRVRSGRKRTRFMRGLALSDRGKSRWKGETRLLLIGKEWTDWGTPIWMNELRTDKDTRRV